MPLWTILASGRPRLAGVNGSESPSASVCRDRLDLRDGRRGTAAHEGAAVAASPDAAGDPESMKPRPLAPSRRGRSASLVHRVATVDHDVALPSSSASSAITPLAMALAATITQTARGAGRSCTSSATPSTWRPWGWCRSDDVWPCAQSVAHVGADLAEADESDLHGEQTPPARSVPDPGAVRGRALGTGPPAPGRTPVTRTSGPTTFGGATDLEPDRHQQVAGAQVGVGVGCGEAGQKMGRVGPGERERPPAPR